MWIVIGGIGAIGGVVALGAWLLGPTLRTFLGPDFEPTPKDDASVEQAIQTRMIDGGGGGGF